MSNLIYRPLRRLILIHVFLFVLLLSVWIVVVSGNPQQDTERLQADTVFFEDNGVGKTLRLKFNYSPAFDFEQQMIHVFEELAWLGDDRITDIFCRNGVVYYRNSREVVGDKCP